MAGLSVDDFLKEHGRGIFLATLEAVDGKPELCKLTPWEDGRGCLCAAALVIPKELIASVTPTDKRHYCCGKILVVVEAHFKEGSTLPLADIWAQVSASAGTMHAVASPHQPHTASHQPHAGVAAFAPQSYSAVMPTDAGAVFQGSGNYPPAQSFGPPAGEMAASAAPSSYAFQNCPPGQMQMACAGKFWCVPPGSSCCINGPCTPPNNICYACAGRFWCVPPGSSCCINGPCTPPNNVCMACAGQFWCVRPGTRCCINGPC